MNLVITLIASPERQNLSQSLITDVSRILNPTYTNWLAPGKACDLFLASNTIQERAEAELAQILSEAEIDHAIQTNNNRRKKALIADMDSTMIHQECIDELALEAGAGDEVAEITTRAMNGEIDFIDAMKMRVAVLEKLNISAINRVLENRITFVPGGRELVQTMKAKGSYTALVSGGFTAFTTQVAKILGFDEHRANILETNNDMLTGRLIEPVLGGEAKVKALYEIGEKLTLSPGDFITVGDGANDIPMLKLAGTGVAFHAKPKVRAVTKIHIDHGDLTSLLYLQGYKENEFVN